MELEVDSEEYLVMDLLDHTSAARDTYGPSPAPEVLTVKVGLTRSEFETAFDEHAKSVLRYVRSRVGAEAAEDIAAETFAAAWAARSAYRSGSGDGTRAWLLGVATNVIARHRVSEAKWLRVRSDAVARGEDRSSECLDVEEIVDVEARRAEAARAARALRRMSPKLRDPLLMHGLGELTYEEIAAALGLPIGTVRSRISRARQKLEGAQP